MNPLNICLSLPSTIASRDKNSHSFQQRPYWFRCHRIWLFSPHAASEQRILSWSYTYIYFLSRLFTAALVQWFLTPHHSSHPSRHLPAVKVQTSSLHAHWYTGELMQKKKKQQWVGFSLQALISKLGGEYRNSPHCHMYHFTLPGKNIQESWSQLEMNHPSYRSHPLHHTNAYGSLEKQGQQTYYWQFC